MQRCIRSSRCATWLAGLALALVADCGKPADPIAQAGEGAWKPPGITLAKSRRNDVAK